MKHFLLTVSCILICTLSFSQTYKVDELRIYSWNGSSDWLQHTTEQFTYANGGNKETNLLGLSFPGSDNLYQFNKTYNANNDMILSVRQTWNNSSMEWEDHSQETYTYYAGTSNVKDITTYNFILGYDVAKISFVYSGSDIVEIIIQYEDSGSLVNAERYEYTYNVPGQPYQEFESAWNTGTSSWDLSERATATYVGGLRTELLVESYNGSTYDPFEKYLTTYSGSLETEYLQQSWNGSSYVNSDRELSTYDGNDNKIVYIFESWNAGTMAWTPYYKEEKDFSVAGALSTESFEISDVRVFPNPASDFIQVSSLNEIDGVILYDSNGRVMKSGKMEDRRLKVDFLKPGIYLMWIESGNRIATKKIIKE